MPSLFRTSVASMRAAARTAVLRAVLLMVALVLAAATASAKSSGCTSVAAAFPPSGTTLISGLPVDLPSFAVGEVLVFTDISGTSPIAVRQGNSATIATFSAPGTYIATPITSAGTSSVTVVNAGGSPDTISAVCNAPSSFTVTVTSDPAAGTASNCTAGSTIDTSCSLRDAVAAVNALSGAAGTIYFAPSVVGTITLTHGLLSLTANTVANITGPGANFLSISGNNASRILQVNSQATATVSGLTFTAANGQGAIEYAGSGLTVMACAFNANQNNVGDGAAIFGSGSGPLTIASSSFYSNTAINGGAIADSSGTLTVNNSTFTNNSVSGSGGAIFALNTNVSMTNTTITANQAVTGGGFFASGGTLALANTAIAGNTALATNAETSGATITDNGGNYFSTGASGTSTLNPKVLPLGNYGGPIETILPAPLSPLLCQGTAANATAVGLILDERNDPRTTVYGSNTCVDIGAAQSSYSLSFVQQPSTTILSQTITPAPTVQWQESDIALDVSGQVIPITAAAGTLIGTTPENTNSSGIATFPGLSIGSVQSNDTLKSTLPLSTSPAISVSATSSQFNVIAPVSSFTITALPSTATAGSAIGFTVTAMDGSSVSTHYTGTITISSTQDPQLAFVGGSVMYTFTAGDNGIHTFTAANGAVFKTAGSDTLTVTDTSYNVAVTSAAVTVSAATPALLTLVSGSPQSVPIGGTFVAPLKVKVTDIYGNPNNGVTVSYTGPSVGAGLSSATSTAITGTNGTASLTAIADATASATAYTVAASVSGISTPVSFSLTNTKAASHISVVQVAPLPVTSGTGVNVQTTFVATLSDATANSAGLPTGYVQFYNGTPLTGTPIGIPQRIMNAQATLMTTFPTGGTYDITAQYLGDDNFTGSDSGTLVEVVVTPSFTVTVSPNMLTIAGGGNASTTVTITPVGNYQGTLTLNCSGLVQFSSCLFNPVAVALNGSNTPQQVTLTVYTLGPANTSSLRTGSGSTLDAGLLWLPGVALAALLALRRRKLTRGLSHMTGVIGLLLLAGAMLGFSGCVKAHFYTPDGTDAVSVNAVGVATAGSGSTNMTQSAALSLVVQ